LAQGLELHTGLGESVRSQASLSFSTLWRLAWAMAATADTAACASGSFASAPLQRLARLLAEPSEEVQQRELSALGVEDAATFVAALRRSSASCQRAAALYPGEGELAVSFNGGKDACVVLFLWLAALAAGAGEGTAPSRQTVIFFDSQLEFEGVRAFVTWAVQSLDLRIIVVEERSFKQGMTDLVAQGLRAVVMGQRRGDPWMENVDAFSPSDAGWPAFMRVNPILEWSYGQVWTFLRKLGLPYCSLYDEGYTSIGNVENTQKNPALHRLDGSYGPAHELIDASLERAGRGRLPPRSSASPPASENGKDSNDGDSSSKSTEASSADAPQTV